MEGIQLRGLDRLELDQMKGEVVYEDEVEFDGSHSGNRGKEEGMGLGEATEWSGMGCGDHKAMMKTVVVEIVENDDGLQRESLGGGQLRSSQSQL